MCESADHVFCRKCLLRSLELSPTCPIDREPLSLSLVSPAPKIVIKLVDELLVSCPFKSTMNCSFVCQRDLMVSHTRHHPPRAAHSPSSPQPEGPPNDSSGSCAHSSGLFDHQHCSPQQPPLMRFQLLSGLATLVEKSPDRELSSHHPQILDRYLSTSSSSSPSLLTSSNLKDLKTCPFLRFGCSFIGTPDMINYHVCVTPDKSFSSDQPKCPFHSVQEILHWFGHLERRNNDLRQQLLHSSVQQQELISALESLQSNFRKLWQSRHSAPGPALDSSAPLVSSPIIPPQPLSTCSSLGTSTCFDPMIRPHVSSSVDMSRAPAIVPVPTGLDRSPHSSSSRLNYDRLSGQRLKSRDCYPSSAACCLPYYITPLPSPSLTSRPPIRVSTFSRKGNLLIRNPGTQANVVNPTEPPNAPSSSLSSHLPAAVEQGPQHAPPSSQSAQSSSLSNANTRTADACPENPLDTDAACTPSESLSNPPSPIYQKLVQVIRLLQKSLSRLHFDRTQSSLSDDRRHIEACLSQNSEIDFGEALGPIHQMIVLSALTDIESMIEDLKL